MIGMLLLFTACTAQAGTQADNRSGTIDATTSCAAFTKASTEDQLDAVTRIAGETGTPEGHTLMLAVTNLCWQRPNATLGHVVSLASAQLESETHPPEASESATASPSDEESTEGEAAPAASTGWLIPGFSATDSLGYKVTLDDVAIDFDSTPSIDITNAKPGKAVVSHPTVTGAGSITNRTSQRNLERLYFDVTGFQQVHSKRECWHGEPSIGYLLRTRSGKLWCLVSASGLKRADSGDLDAYGAFSLDVEETAALDLSKSEDNFYSPYAGEVAEDKADQIVAQAVNTPVVWTLNGSHYHEGRNEWTVDDAKPRKPLEVEYFYSGQWHSDTLSWLAKSGSF